MFVIGEAPGELLDWALKTHLSALNIAFRAGQTELMTNLVFSYPAINQLTDSKYVYIKERKQLVSHWNRFIPLRNSKYTNVVGVVLLIYFLSIRTDFCCDFLIKRFGGRNYSVPTYASVYKTFINFRPSLL